MLLKLGLTGREFAKVSVQRPQAPSRLSSPPPKACGEAWRFTGIPAFLGLKLMLALEKRAERVPVPCLITVLKRFATEDFELERDWETFQTLPRKSVPGFVDAVFADQLTPLQDDPIDCVGDCLR